MLTRRKAVTTGVLASVGAAVAGTVSEGAVSAAPLEQDAAATLAVEREMVKMLAAIRDELQGLRRQLASSQMPTSAGITKIRQSQRQFLKGNQKYRTSSRWARTCGTNWSIGTCPRLAR